MPIIVATQVSASFSSDFEQIIIAPAVTVWEDSGSSTAVTSFHNNDFLDNFGAILDTTGAGVLFNFAAGGRIINEAAGVITGSKAISIGSSDVLIVNDGIIAGSELGTGVFFDVNGSGGILDNHGTVRGDLAGVETSSAHDITVLNSGMVESDADAFFIHDSAGAIAHVVNSGTVLGGNHSITAASALDLQNTGTLIGAVLLLSSTTTAADNDHVINQGSIVGTVRLGLGDDFFSNAGGGTSGAIFGEVGNDRIIGGSSNDQISGGPGIDALTGGPGKDQFIFDAALGPANIDRITDFTHKADTIDLSHAIFTAVNASGPLHSAMFTATGKETAQTRILYNPHNGFLSYDQDGSGHAFAPIQFARLNAHLSLTAHDFVVVG